MYDVFLYIYDLSNGLAAQISMQLTGRHFKAIYHTSIVIHGREYFFGGSGIESSLPSQSPHGTPIEKRLVGQTEVDQNLWHSFLEDCSQDYGVGKYHLLEFNCNTFSDAALQFTLGQRIDPEIAALPSDFLSTPFGMMLRPQIDAMYAPRAAGTTNTINHSVKTEAVIDGPSSGRKIDRCADCYRFNQTPTLTKLFAKIRSQQDDPFLLPELEAYTSAIIRGIKIDKIMEFSKVAAFFRSYFQNISTNEAYPGLDLFRILTLHEPFATYQKSDTSILELIFAMDLHDDTNGSKSLVLVLHSLCNWVVDVDLRPLIVPLLRQHDKLEFITNAPLSSINAVQQAGLETIWNFILMEDRVDDDFAVACLASVAECTAEQLNDLKQRIITELLTGGSEAVQEMAEILDLTA